MLPGKVDCVRQVSISWTLKSSVLGKVVSYGGQCWRLTFFVGGNYLVFKVVVKLTYLLAIIGGHSQPFDQTKFHVVEGIDNAFDHMELCFLSYKQKNYFSENWLVFF